jgi:hypothetical protein
MKSNCQARDGLLAQAPGGVRPLDRVRFTGAAPARSRAEGLSALVSKQLGRATRRSRCAGELHVQSGGYPRTPTAASVS